MIEREKMTHFLLCFRDATGGLQDGLRESPFAASVPEPSVDFFWRAKSVRSIQTVLGTAEHIRREILPFALALANGLEQLLANMPAWRGPISVKFVIPAHKK